HIAESACLRRPCLWHAGCLAAAHIRRVIMKIKRIVGAVTMFMAIVCLPLGLVSVGCSAADDGPDGLQAAEQLRPDWNPAHGPFCTFNCGPVTAAVSASPSPVFLPPNTAGNTTLHWTWNESAATPVAEYACVYVSVNNESSMHVVDCEHPGNNYTVPI